MNLLKRLATLFRGGGAPSADKRYLTIYVLSRRCNEPVSGQVDLLNELSKPDEGEYAFYTRKVLHTTGEHRCFSEVEVQLYFDQNKQVVHHEVEGGRWLTSAEYTVELARFNAPPPEEDEAEAKADEVTDETVEAPSSGGKAKSAEGAAPTPSRPESPAPNPQAEEDHHA